MSVKGQTHNKRQREFALKEKRERKKAKKEDRRNGILPEADGTDGEPIVEAQPEAEAAWVQ